MSSVSSSSSSSGQLNPDYQALSAQLTSDSEKIAEKAMGLFVKAANAEPFKRVRELPLKVQDSDETVTLRFTVKDLIELNHKACELGNRHVEILKSSVKDGIAQFELIDCPFQGMTDEERAAAEEAFDADDLLTKENGTKFISFLLRLDQNKSYMADYLDEHGIESDDESEDECCVDQGDLSGILVLLTHMIPKNLFEGEAEIDLSVYKSAQLNKLSNRQILDLLSLTKMIPQNYPGLIALQIRLYDAFKVPASYLKDDYQSWVKLQLALLKDQNFLNTILDWKDYPIEKRVEKAEAFIKHYASAYGITCPKLEVENVTHTTQAAYSFGTDTLSIKPEFLRKVDFGTILHVLFHEMTHCRQDAFHMRKDLSSEQAELAELFHFNGSSYIDEATHGYEVYGTQPLEVQAYANQLRMVQFFRDKMLVKLKDSSESQRIRNLYWDFQKAVDYVREYSLGKLYYNVSDENDQPGAGMVVTEKLYAAGWNAFAQAIMKSLHGLDTSRAEDAAAFDKFLGISPVSLELDLKNSPKSRRQLKWLHEAL